ncbi:MAG: trypsin-like serine protease [Flavobacteriales bacterium]|nr:trypsin-like serine protease [Flavobacteriales bacterium]
MNKRKYLALLGLFGFILTSCIGQPSKDQITDLSDPAVFAENFTSICKVGIKGGDGTLIEKNWVLTAAHVAEGMYQRTNGDLSVYFENGTEYKVKNVFLHPKFVPMGLYDIALLELERNVKDIAPIELNEDTNEVNKMIFLVGHGDKKRSDGTWIKDGKLRAYTNMIDQVTETHLIFDYDSPENGATEREGTSGPGDSGGPALLKVNDKYFVAGVSSMGEPGMDGPASFGAIEHFVRVLKFKDWILETINLPDTKKAFSLTETTTTNLSSNIDLSGSDQAKNAQIIIDALSSFSKEKMIDAISRSYDTEILKRRNAEEIYHNMPVLIEKLQNSKLKQVLSTSSNKISHLMIKGQEEYILDIYFKESSYKIDQMGFGRLN